MNIFKKSIVIFTDGSASKNGSIRATGGIGVFFSNDNEKNVSCETRLALKQLIPSFNFTKVTNNISELAAILKAFDLSRSDLRLGHTVIIKTDSMYCINSLTKWYIGWGKNGWVNSKKTAVLNKEIIQDIVDNYIKPYNSQIKFVKVKAHSNAPPINSPLYQDFWGNFKADQLATSFL
jgi:ribonuclease HI